MNNKKIRLGVNLDHIAFIKKSRGTEYPNLVEAVKISEDAGADLITIHLREDRRHIQDHDVKIIRENARILNLEMAHTDEMIKVALNIKPDFCCIVPEKRNEVTTEGGLDLVSLDNSKLQTMKNNIQILAESNIKTSLFIDPDENQIKIAKSVGAELVELHTGYYANSHNPDSSTSSLEKLMNAAEIANKLGLLVNAGHGLNYDNLSPICKIKHLNELNIGHSIISQSVFTGLKDAIEKILSIIRNCD